MTTVARTRQDAEQLAWSVWEHLGAGRLADGLAVLDDGGTWWEMATRAEQPMAQMKRVLAEILGIVPMTFDRIGAVVEGDRVALMVESHAQLPGGGTYNNVYTFVTTLAPDRDVIVGIREYVDTYHASTTLIPALVAELKRRGTDSLLARMLGR